MLQRRNPLLENKKLTGLSVAAGDGPRDFSNLGIISSLLVNTKPLGQRNVAGDDSTGHLAFPNPLYTGRGSNLAHVGEGEIHDTAAWRNHFRWQQEQLLGHDTHVMITNQYKTWTPIALPNLIPTNIK
jgi:hypothetical protein